MQRTNNHNHNGMNIMSTHDKHYKNMKVPKSVSTWSLHRKTKLYWELSSGYRGRGPIHTVCYALDTIRILYACKLPQRLYARVYELCGDIIVGNYKAKAKSLLSDTRNVIQLADIAKTKNVGLHSIDSNTSTSATKVG